MIYQYWWIVWKFHSQMKHCGVKISRQIIRRQDWTIVTLALMGIKCWGQVWKKIDFFLIWYIKEERDNDGERKSKRGTWRAINFPVVSSIAAAPFHILPIRTFPNQKNTSPSLKWRQWWSPTFPPAPKLCRLQRWYTKNKVMGYTAGGTLVLGKKKITCGNLLALLAVPEKLTGNNGSPAQHLSWHNIKRWFWHRIDFKKKKRKRRRTARRRKGRGGRGWARG